MWVSDELDKEKWCGNRSEQDLLDEHVKARKEINEYLKDNGYCLECGGLF